MTREAKGNLVEVFSSIEGEALDAGVKTLFVRFAGCDFSCRYCDTPGSRGEAPSAFPVYAGRQGSARLVPNPTTPRQVVRLAEELSRTAGPYKRVSLTGGEPLEQEQFCLEVGKAFRKERFYVSVETRGTLWEAIEKVREGVDCILMDIKVPSAARCEPLWEEHREFIRAAGKTRIVFKVVADEHFTDEEIEKVTRTVRSRTQPAPVVLQPVTRKTGRVDPRAVERLIEAQSVMLATLDDVRVLPQIHPILGIH